LIVLSTLILVACATGGQIERKASDEDVPSTVTASPLPCLFFKW
jgi:hypothetical protein